MDSPSLNEKPQSPSTTRRDTLCSSDGSTICGSEAENKDLESQSIKPISRSWSSYIGLSSPVSANLDDIEEDIVESDGEEVADVSASDLQRSM